MCKKIVSVFFALCMVMSLAAGAFAAKDGGMQIEDLKKVIDKEKDKMATWNDMTMDEFLRELKRVLPENDEIELSFSKESDFRVYNATAKKDGSIFANIQFKCDVYTRHEMYTVKIPMLDDLSTPVVDDTKKQEENKNDQPSVTEPEEKKDIATAPVSFNDVKAGAYYEAAVKWAVEKGITAGTSDTTFSPDNTCTRAQILTFLWRAVGSPKATAGNPFADVKESDYYYDAAVWASEKGMVSGTTFEADTPCTRASTVTYLWLNAGAPWADSEIEFADVDMDAEYAEAVAWAVEEGVTSGTSATTFAPDTVCSRGQIVTFLNRAIK